MSENFKKNGLLVKNVLQRIYEKFDENLENKDFSSNFHILLQDFDSRKFRSKNLLTKEEFDRISENFENFGNTLINVDSEKRNIIDTLDLEGNSNGEQYLFINLKEDVESEVEVV